MTLKGTSSLQRTTYFHLYFHDSMLIFQKQPISLDSGIIEFAGVILRDSLKKAVLRRLKALKPEFPEFITREGQPLTPHIIPSASS